MSVLRILLQSVMMHVQERDAAHSSTATAVQVVIQVSDPAQASQQVSAAEQPIRLALHVHERSSAPEAATGPQADDAAVQRQMQDLQASNMAELHTLQEQVAALQADLAAAAATIAELEAASAASASRAQEQEPGKRQSEQQLAEASAARDSMRQQLAAVEAASADKQRLLAELEAAGAADQQRLAELEQLCQQHEHQVAALEARIMVRACPTACSFCACCMLTGRETNRAGHFAARYSRLGVTSTIMA